ncbi:MAG: biopolymer transporter ExbD [Pseudobdellovibrionaceae bacterium]|nr:biopolymer transporter ExbD [Bdellovibrionales bacterium]USN47788.1 MAG: biopolymer transporter ExbD [Pseudobdellovibrionaceae bacterium]
MAKQVNEELNLTPFIGLFAMLVVLLLVTAVWNRVYVFQTNTSASTASDSSTPPKKEVTLSVTIMGDRLEMSEDEKGTTIMHQNDEVNKERFIATLGEWRQRYPEKKDVVLNTDNRVPYYQLIEVFDVLIGHDWPDVGVSTQ